MGGEAYLRIDVPQQALCSIIEQVPTPCDAAMALECELWGLWLADIKPSRWSGLQDDRDFDVQLLYASRCHLCYTEHRSNSTGKQRRTCGLGRTL